MTNDDRIRELGLHPDATKDEIIAAFEQRDFDKEVEAFTKQLVPALGDAVRSCSYYQGRPNRASFDAVRTVLKFMPHASRSYFEGPSPQVEQALQWRRDKERFAEYVEAFVTGLHPAIRDAARTCLARMDELTSPQRITEIKALIDAAEFMVVRTTPKAEPETAPPVMVPPSDDEAVPLPRFEANQVRQAFVVFVALRCQGLQVLTGVKGARQLLGMPHNGHADATVEKYLRDNTFADACDALIAWTAEREDRWLRIWAAFRSDWNIPAEIKGPAQDRTE